jgi:type VI secretion system ImpM family protein
MSEAGGSGPVGLYGKIAAQADFLRANAGQFSRAGLDRWFQDGIEILHKEGTRLPTERTAFLLTPEGVSGVFVGAFVPSEDAVGRLFPLIVFAETSVTRDLDQLAGVARVYGEFIAQAGAVVEGSAGLAGAEVAARMNELTLDSTWRAPDAAAWQQEPAGPLRAALGDSSRALAYAMRTFAMACDQVAKADASGRAPVVVVDAPAPTPATVQMWFEFARRQMRGPGRSVSALWTEGAEGRLLLALGAPPPALLSYLANRKHKASRLWPLRTEIGSALDQADLALTPAQRARVGDVGGTLGQLVAAFGR